MKLEEVRRRKKAHISVGKITNNQWQWTQIRKVGKIRNIFGGNFINNFFLFRPIKREGSWANASLRAHSSSRCKCQKD